MPCRAVSHVSAFLVFHRLLGLCFRHIQLSANTISKAGQGHRRPARGHERVGEPLALPQVPAPLDRRQLVVIGDGRFVLVDIQSVIARAVGAHPESYSSSGNAKLVDALGAAVGLLPGRNPVGCCAENADRLSAFFGEDGAGRVDDARPCGASRR